MAGRVHRTTVATTSSAYPAGKSQQRRLPLAALSRRTSDTAPKSTSSTSMRVKYRQRFPQLHEDILPPRIDLCDTGPIRDRRFSGLTALYGVSFLHRCLSWQMPPSAPEMLLHGGCPDPAANSPSRRVSSLPAWSALTLPGHGDSIPPATPTNGTQRTSGCFKRNL